MQLGRTDKWYVDQTQMGYEALAFALKAQYPQLRVAIGPASLNNQFVGTNPPKAQIESFIAGFVPSPLDQGNPPDFGRKAPSAVTQTLAANTAPNLGTAPSSAAVPKRGENVWVLVPGIGPVEAIFVASLPDGLVLIDLDGVQTPVERSAVHSDPLAAEAAALRPAEPFEPSTATPEPPATSATEPPPAASASATEPPVAPPEPPSASAPAREPTETPEADPGAVGLS